MESYSCGLFARRYYTYAITGLAGIPRRIPGISLSNGNGSTDAARVVLSRVVLRLSFGRRFRPTASWGRTASSREVGTPLRCSLDVWICRVVVPSRNRLINQPHWIRHQSSLCLSPRPSMRMRTFVLASINVSLGRIGFLSPIGDLRGEISLFKDSHSLNKQRTMDSWPKTSDRLIQERPFARQNRYPFRQGILNSRKKPYGLA